MCGGSIPSRAIYIFWKGSEEAKRGGLVNPLPSGSGVRIPPLPFYGHSLKVELRSPKPSVWVQFLLPVYKNMAGVVKWLTHQIVALACVGSIPITRLFYIIGV